jgi:hypothetical protein
MRPKTLVVVRSRPHAELAAAVLWAAARSAERDHIGDGLVVARGRMLRQVARELLKIHNLQPFDPPSDPT